VPGKELLMSFEILLFLLAFLFPSIFGGLFGGS
jgi:hypothetical protein